MISNVTGILTVSSRSKNTSNVTPVTPQVQYQTLDLKVDLCYGDIMLNEIDSMDPYQQHMCAYVALCIEEEFFKKIQTHKYKCTCCADVLCTANEKILDEFLAMKSEESQPSASTLKIVIFSNAIMKMYSEKYNQGTNMSCVGKTISANLDMDELYSNFFITHDESTMFTHKEEFISQLVETYMIMKSRKIGKKLTDEERGQLLRYRRRRAYILAGQ